MVKIEGARGKRYIAVKKDKMAYYNTYNVIIAQNIFSYDDSAVNKGIAAGLV